MKTEDTAWEPWTAEGKPIYAVRPLPAPVTTPLAAENAVWRETDSIKVASVLDAGIEAPNANTHRPRVEVRMRYDDHAVYVYFQVDDRYVRTIETKPHGKVWEDACVEFFVQPLSERGYINFEVNSGGTMLASYHEHPSWTGVELTKGGRLPEERYSRVQILASLPKTVEPENPNFVAWSIAYRIPLSVFEDYLGPLGPLSGKTWRANFYKCAENNSHPHWISWSTIVEGQDFHAPRWFGVLNFT